MDQSPSYQSFINSPYKSIKHSTYFKVYDELFSRYRDKSITFVEIGVLGGGSLFMWRDFFGPKARIIGVDLNPNAKKWEEHGFEIFIGSQSNENFWNDFIKSVGQIDVVLDDGGHTYLQQIVTTESLLPHINDHGMLVVEDTHTSYMDGFGPRRHSFVEYTKKMVDKINQRFGLFDRGTSETRVWSIQTFESFVVFHVNKKATNRLSEWTSNNGSDDSAVDFRDHGKTSVQTFDRFVTIFKFLKHIPGVKFLAINTRNFLVNKSDSRPLKKYFND